MLIRTTHTLLVDEVLLSRCKRPAELGSDLIGFVGQLQAGDASVFLWIIDRSSPAIFAKLSI